MIKMVLIPFGKLCQGRPLREHEYIMHNRVSARGLLGEGGERKSERPSQSGDLREAGRQTDRD